MRPRASFLPAALWVAATGLAACAGPVGDLPVVRGVVSPACCGPVGEAAGVDPRAAPVPGEATFTYLGVGGWRIEWAGRSILTAPFFSNPSVLRVGLWTMGPDTARIHRFLGPVRDASAVLVGHAHYDHLLDLPHILTHDAPAARVVGSPTVGHLLAAAPGFQSTRMVRADTVAGDAARPGGWIELAGGRARVMPLAAGHAPHFQGIRLMEGRLHRDQRWLPGAAAGWPEGRTYAYLLDLLGPEGTVALRIYYQDAASEAPAGLVPPLAVEDRRRIDVAILCPPGFDEVDGYPGAFLEAESPRHVLLGHWEDFFRPRSEPLRVVPGTDLEDFLDELRESLPDDASWTLPAPGAEVRMKTGGAS